MRYKAVFFDLDGTLMDTSEGIFATARQTMAELGLEIPQDSDFRKFVGPPLKDCFRITFGIQDDELLDRCASTYRGIYHKENYLRAHFYDGMPEVLSELKRNGYRIAVTSMKNEEIIKKIAESFTPFSFFDELLGFNATEGKTTKKEIVLDGCRRFDLEPSECVLVGDTQIDAEGARQAGLDCIRINWGFGFVPGEPGTISEPKEILGIV